MDDLIELDELFADAMKQAKQRTVVRELRQKTKFTNLKEDESKLLKEYEDKELWHTVERHAIIDLMKCDCCGMISPVFRGLFNYQLHKTDPHARRWISTTYTGNPNIPKKQHFQEQHTEYCAFCVAGAGFANDLLTAPVEGTVQ